MTANGLAILLFASAAMNVSAQSHDPFTRDELVRVLTLFMHADKAREEVDRDWAVPSPHPKLPPGLQVPQPPEGVRVLAFGSVSGISYTGDMLQLLSLLSPEAEAKVARYRRRFTTGLTIPFEEEAAWQARRKELLDMPEVKRWLAGEEAPFEQD